MTLAPLGGAITIVDSIVMINQGTNQPAVMDFNAGAPEVTVVFDADSAALLGPLRAAAGLTIAQAQNLMAAIAAELSAWRPPLADKAVNLRADGES